jgi:hypothetical protein
VQYFYHQTSRCQNCSCFIEQKVYHWSIKHFQVSLCIPCQQAIGDKVLSTTRETSKLYFSLKRRGVPAELEKSDENKTVDIAITDARVNIEVDGPQHNYNPLQALDDLKRAFQSIRKDYLTLHIPKALIAYDLEEAVDCITEFLNTSKQSGSLAV